MLAAPTSASRSNVLIAHCIPKQTIRFLIDTKPGADASEMCTFHIMCLRERFANVFPLTEAMALSHKVVKLS